MIGVMKILLSPISPGATMKKYWLRSIEILCKNIKPNSKQAEACNSYLIEIVLISVKILGAYTMEEIPAMLKQNLNVDFKKFFIIFRGIEGFESSIKKFFKYLIS